jgi:hypothetical protein
MTTLFIDVNYFISLNIYDVLPSAQWITRIEDCNLGNNSGKGRIYVKNETLRQQYIHDETWSTKLKPGPDSTLEEMILVDPTI